MSSYEMVTAPERAATHPLGDCHECRATDLVGLDRTRWFARQPVGPDDLTQDQRYFREKHRRHNRLLHGWGIVCGARVRAREGCQVAVEPGYVLGPYGDEILIPDEITVDLCREDLDGFASCGPTDPWCSDVRVARPEGRPVYLAVRYCELPARPVRVMSCGCGCDDTECEYSRIRDSYAIGVLEELPESYRPMRPPAQDALQCAGGPRTCPPCPSEPWVVLADITLADGEVAELDCASHRRYVASFGDFYFTCRPAPPANPPVIVAHWPPNGANLASPQTPEEKQWRPSWQERKRVEITFDKEMDAAQLARPDDWLRVWRIADLFEFIPGERVQLRHDPGASSTLGAQGFTAVYDVGELDAVGGDIRYLVQIRSGNGAITNAGADPLDLDADFDGTSLSLSTRNTLWNGGFQTSLGRDDWDALVSTGAKLPASGDGSPGGSFALVFDAPKVG